MEEVLKMTWLKVFENRAFLIEVTEDVFNLSLCGTTDCLWVSVFFYLSQGCASWKWYFPFHYAPFASDFKDIKGMFSDFEKGTKPVIWNALHGHTNSVMRDFCLVIWFVLVFLMCWLLIYTCHHNSSLQFKPLEQLMSVFPAASGNFLPTTWRALMADPVSAKFISDLYMKLHSVH